MPDSLRHPSGRDRCRPRIPARWIPDQVRGDGEAGGHGAAASRHSAEHGFTTSRRSAEHGFTLVELMVVIVVIGLASAAALWAMPDPHGRLVDEAARFAVRARAARDAAIVNARPVSVWVTPAGYGFDQWRGGQWQALADAPLRVARWADGTTATVAGRTRVTFDPTGATDRGLAVPLRRERTRVTVSIGGDGAVRVDG